MQSQSSAPSAQASAKDVARKKTRKKRINQAVKTSGAPGLKHMENPYLRTLLDPEKYKSVRYPDGYAGKTACLQGLLNQNLYYFPADGAGTPAVEPAGTFLAYTSPVMIHPVLQYAMATVGANNAIQMFADEQGDETGIFPLVEDTSSISVVSGQMCVRGDGTVVNLRGPWSWSDQDFSMFPFTSQLSDGTTIYGVPFGATLSAGACTVRFFIHYAEQLSAGDVTTLYALRADGTTVSGTWTAGAGDARGVITLNVASLLTGYGGGAYSGIALPGISFRMKLALTAGSAPTARMIPIMGWAITIPATGGGAVVTNRFTPVDFPDTSTYADTVDKYRVVSMSGWTEYEGSDLNNGGQIAACYYGGGQSPMGNGLWAYSRVANLPGGFQGPLRTGNYTIWRTTDPADMLFRPLNSPRRWELPYLVVVGIASTPTQVNALRLRVPSNFEIVSTSQLYSYAQTPGSPLLIAHANDALREFPLSMENPLHWAAIKDVLRGALNKAKDVTKWVADNKGWLVPAATAVGSLVL